MNKYPVKLVLRIDWSELDIFGHINNVMFFKYIQASRVNYWEAIGLTKQYEKKQIGPILASTACQFRKPLFYPGNIVIHAKMEFIKRTSFGIQHQIINDNKEIVAEANDVIVMYDFKKKEKILFPDVLRERVENLEKRKFDSKIK